MNVSLPSEFVPFVDDLVATGSYSTAEDVVRDALAQMRDRHTMFEALKASLEDAQAEISRGEGVPFDVDEILAEGRRIYAKRHGD
ncbi:MAG TPA: type II toxin-antitoxin system ParD family antitoxin [Pirellulaceae bacterium]|nr:type II toxin-antitoxin system ParD family antitoxin [Pirellulaceae bacterium]